MSSENTAQALPLVSVICRSIGRPELQQALQSISAQSWSNLEIVLVDAGGRGLGDYTSASANIPVRLVSDGKQYSRSQAANVGLETAKGDYLMFLDDDDWIAVDHIENLVNCLQSQPKIKVAYSNTQKTDVTGAPLSYVFKDEFDPVLLMRDNFIPIHALLFHRDLLKHKVKFDESFDIYEDWDFWLQLSQHSTFAHVDKTTAYYREGGESETAATDTHSRYNNESLLGRGRAAIFNKWLPHWSGAQLNQLIGSLDQSKALQDLADALHLARVDLDAAIADRHSFESANLQLQHKLEHAEQLLQDKNKQVEALHDHTANLERHSNELTAVLHEIHSSPSWKLMGPFRRTARFINSLFSDKPTEQESKSEQLQKEHNKEQQKNQ